MRCKSLGQGKNKKAFCTLERQNVVTLKREYFFFSCNCKQSLELLNLWNFLISGIHLVSVDLKISEGISSLVNTRKELS